MSKIGITKTQSQNVHKIVYMANEYPDKTMMELGKLIQMTGFEINSAIWRAQELGYLFVDKKTGRYKVESVPAEWGFGPEVEEIMANIVYVIGKVNGDEIDMDEDFFTTWHRGSAPHDVIIATKKLLNDKKIASYEVINVTEIKPSKKKLGRGEKSKFNDEKYLFYTLPANAKHQWGRKQFPDQTKLK